MNRGSHMPRPGQSHGVWGAPEGLVWDPQVGAYWDVQGGVYIAPPSGRVIAPPEGAMVEPHIAPPTGPAVAPHPAAHYIAPPVIPPGWHPPPEMHAPPAPPIIPPGWHPPTHTAPAPPGRPVMSRPRPAPPSARKTAAFVPPVQDAQGSGEQNIIRWGDQQSLSVAAQITGFTSGQLVRVNRRFPETWSITLFAFVNPPNRANWAAQIGFTVIFGVGSAQVSFAPADQLGFIFNMGSAMAAPAVEDYLTLATPYLVAYRTIVLPVKDLQITASAFNQDATGEQQIQLGAFAAPRFLQPQPAQAPPDDASEAGDQTTEWMGPGFHPEPVHYK